MFKKCIKKVVNISCVVGLSILVNLSINNTCGHIDTNTIVAEKEVIKKEEVIIPPSPQVQSSNQNTIEETIEDDIIDNSKEETIEGFDPQLEELDQLHFTKEDIERYKNYKEDLINEYGEEVYNLMNQEAGINNEEESFYHFIKYGI